DRRAVELGQRLRRAPQSRRHDLVNEAHGGFLRAALTIANPENWNFSRRVYSARAEEPILNVA
ncbi:MAG TPA: hypothetical protein VFR21_00960, partial [Bradyrhizobium sp.]|nr:hypothetical protein [Bradyrhizobium sp.]